MGHKENGNHGHSHSHGAHGHSHDHGKKNTRVSAQPAGHGHSHSHTHSHSHGSGKKKTCSRTCRLSFMLSMTFSYFLVEIIVGETTRSITLMADSFHMLSDVVALVISLVSIRVSKKKSTKNTFGWVRAEVLGALVNAVFLVSLCLGIVIDAIKRFIETENIKEPKLLLIVSCIGLGINLVSLGLLGHDHAHSVPASAYEIVEPLSESAIESIEIMDMPPPNTPLDTNNNASSQHHDEQHAVSGHKIRKGDRMRNRVGSHDEDETYGDDAATVIRISENERNTKKQASRQQSMQIEKPKKQRCGFLGKLPFAF